MWANGERNKKLTVKINYLTAVVSLPGDGVRLTQLRGLRENTTKAVSLKTHQLLLYSSGHRGKCQGRVYQVMYITKVLTELTIVHVLKSAPMD